MNERVMQFRIGLFVIFAGLVLTMLIVWFGESPSLLRRHVYVVAHYEEAPSVSEGIPIRKSGIRVGEVSSIAFDERPGQSDGVLVTLSLDSRYKFKEGTVPRITRSLIGDVSIDLLPGAGPGPLKTSDRPEGAPIIEGTITADPAKALAAATEAFTKAGDTLNTINEAAAGISKFTQNSDKVGQILATWKETGDRVSAAADGIDRFIKTNEAEIQPAVANLREVSHKLNTTLDPATQESLRSGIRQFHTATNQLNRSLEEALPLFRDLGGSPASNPKTDFGQAVRRINIIASDLGLLTQALRGPNGRLNTQGSLQKLLLQPEVYDNINRFALNGTATFNSFKPVLAAFRVFADKISRDP
ncbi:MAG: MlaD family protein, partial [Isosphaeraceae bacterium]